MSRAPRKLSSADVYHVVFRGSGKQIIFEDDNDRLLFLRLLNKYILELGGEVYAWILMGNHVHLVLHMDIEDIATLMRKLGATYFRNFNNKADKSGEVTEDRFYSEPINTDEYLLTCVRYVHQNIEKAGVCAMEDYVWSSYRGYVGLTTRMVPLRANTDFVLAVFGGVDDFVRFHQDRNYAVPCIDIGKTALRMDDGEALVVAKSLLGEEAFAHLKELDKVARDEAIRKLRSNHLSCRQIQRLTGIGRGAVMRA